MPTSRQLNDAICELKSPNCDFLIRNDRTGRPFVGRSDFTMVFRKVKSHAMVYLGRRALNARALRHTAICRMHRTGSDPFTISSMTGHQPVDVMKTLKSYMVDYESLARTAALRLHVDDGGSENDFTPADPNDPRWQTKRRPDGFKPDLLATPIGSGSSRRVGVRIGQAAAPAELQALDADARGSAMESNRPGGRYRDPSPKALAEALGLEVKSIADPS